MSAELPITDQITAHRKMWQELWWNMAKGDITSYTEIKKMDVMEFWSFFDRWREHNKQEHERLKKENSNNKSKK